MPGGTAVELAGLTIRAGGRVLLQDAAARFEAGSVVLIVGASGAGKSLLLRMLAGLIDRSNPEVRVSGSVRFGGREAGGVGNRPPVGVVFQSFALFDELSPLGNVRFAFDHRPSRRARAQRGLSPQALLEQLGVPQGVQTGVLSGGQRQRLAIARTLAYEPDVILYDEPTSGLDAATADEATSLIERTHKSHFQTSIIVTHDYASLAKIADRLFLLDADTQSLREIDRRDWPTLREQLKAPPPIDAAYVDQGRLASRWAKGAATAAGEFFVATTQIVERALSAPLYLLPRWKHPWWGLRYLLHYLRLVGGPSAWLYIAIAGAIVGFVTTYFTFEFLPYASYTEPLLIEDLLGSMGFALYRILVPVLATILVAARCGAAVASDVGGKVYTQQVEALQTFGIRPPRYLLTGILYAFLIGTPLLLGIGYFAAKAVSVAAFTATHLDRGPAFWQLHFHRELVVPGQMFYRGTGWLIAKTLLSAAGIGLIAYYRGASPKYSSRDVSTGITSTILWATLHVLFVHFVFAFFEFE